MRATPRRAPEKSTRTHAGREHITAPTIRPQGLLLWIAGMVSLSGALSRLIPSICWFHLRLLAVIGAALRALGRHVWNVRKLEVRTAACADD